MLRFHFRFAIGSRIGTHPPGAEQGFGISTQEFSERTARAGKGNTGRNLGFKKKVIFVYVVFHAAVPNWNCVYSLILIPGN